MKSLLLCGFAFVLASLTATRAAAAPSMVNFTFTGGNGTLTLTLDTPVQYTVINYAMDPQAAPVFIIGNTGDFANGGGQGAGYGVTGNITFSVDGGPTQNLYVLGSGYQSPYDWEPQDGYVTGDLPGVGAGDTVTLTAGTLTVSGFTGTVPASGPYDTYIVDGLGYILSEPGVAVPEPSTWAMLSLGAAGMSLVVLRRQHTA